MMYSITVERDLPTWIIGAEEEIVSGKRRQGAYFENLAGTMQSLENKLIGI